MSATLGGEKGGWKEERLLGSGGFGAVHLWKDKVIYDRPGHQLVTNKKYTGFPHKRCYPDPFKTLFFVTLTSNQTFT